MNNFKSEFEALNLKLVLDTLEYVRTFSGETVLIKLGGSALQDTALVESICQDLALIRSIGISTVLVHGGGPAINDELKLHGIEWNFINGLRVTTPEMMNIVEMVLAGKMNQKIVRTLNQAGVKAVGVSGTDAAILKCKQMNAELGQVGEIEFVDSTFIKTILNTQSEAGTGFIPVIAPIGFGPNGEAMNINADWAAARVASALGISKIIYLTDQDGILDSKKSLISELDLEGLSDLIKDGTVSGGMRAKVETIRYALKSGIRDVHILNAKRPHSLIEELFTSKGVGTVCRDIIRAKQTIGDSFVISMRKKRNLNNLKKILLNSKANKRFSIKKIVKKSKNKSGGNKNVNA